MKKIFLEMYLKKNLGDDLFLQTIAQRYKDIKFFTAAENDYFDSYDFDNVCGRTFACKILDKVKGLVFRKKFGNNKKYIANIILGGSMFMEKNDKEDKLLEELRKKYGGKIPLFVVGSNFGPYDDQFYYDAYKRVFEKAEDVCFRDRYSASLFSDLCNVRVAPDIVFGLDVAKYDTKQEKKIVISVIDLENRKKLSKYSKVYEEKIAEVALWYAKNGYEVVLMSFCKFEGDEDAIKRVLSRTSNDKIRPYYYHGNIGEALRLISSSEIVVGTRFHAVVLGLVFKKKVFPIIYSDKTKKMLEDINFDGISLRIEDIDSIEDPEIIMKSLCYGEIRELSEDAEEHFKKLDVFLKRG
ncbi:polysaccharide pyruvyl transferase family protein [Candidatus Saccharibacteria bacterium]|nr:polysaccharide pyruvyl transferase family protein [Candidatus Saccharibacteria bacterium]